jgi:membrane protein DedA with SNARE-associated domain
VTGLVRDYGLIIVFLAIALETAGLPLPGETTLVFAAVAASQGKYSIEWVITIAAAGAIIGDNTGYWLGRKLGRGFLQRYGVVRRFSERV